MAFWAEIDDDYLLRYQEWHNCEHIPERVAIPGFRAGRRYRALDGRPAFLMMYETDGAHVMVSDAYRAALDSPTEWTREALTHFRKPVRIVYSRVAEAGKVGAAAAPYTTTLRFSLANEVALARITEMAGALCAIPTVNRTRIFLSDTAGSRMATSERAIYGGNAADQTHLALVDHDRPPAEVKQKLLSALQTGTGARCDDAVLDSYWLEFSLIG
jgi:hypothetical protein